MSLSISEISEYDSEEARIMAWYITGIRHEIIRISKKHEKLRRKEMLILNKPVNGSEDFSIELVDIIADCNNILSNTEEKIDIENALSNLTTKQQQVTKMLFYQDMTEKEAAKQLEISQPAVNSIKNRALKKIKKYLNECVN